MEFAKKGRNIVGVIMAASLILVMLSIIIIPSKKCEVCSSNYIPKDTSQGFYLVAGTLLIVSILAATLYLLSYIPELYFREKKGDKKWHHYL